MPPRSATKKVAFRIDIRDQRIPNGGRFTVSARTTSGPEFRRREAAVRALIDAAEWDILERIRTPGDERLHIGDVTAAVGRGDLDSLRRTGTQPLQMGAVIDRLLRTKEATRKVTTARQVRMITDQLETFFGVQRIGGVVVRDVSLVSITRQRCEDFLHEPKANGKPWAPRTQNLKRTYAQEVWELAIAEEIETAERERRRPLLTRNPWKQVEAAQVVPTRVIFLTAEERDALLDRIEGRPAAALMALGYHAGLRVSEARYLRTGIDVDLEAGYIRIQNRGGQFAWTSKNLRERDVPINATLRAILEEHVRRGYAGDRYFFRTPGRDQPVSSDTAREWWTKAYEAAGIRWGRDEADTVVYHTGRHTFCSLLVQQGVSPLIVAELVGDKYEEVIKTYGHLTPKNLRDAIQKLERVEIGTLSNESSNESRG